MPSEGEGELYYWKLLTVALLNTKTLKMERREMLLIMQQSIPES